MAIGKVIKEGIKAVTKGAKRGRKTKAQRAAETRKKNAAAKRAAEGLPPKKKMAMKPGSARRRAEGTPKGTLTGMSTKEKRERSLLINKVKKEMEASKRGTQPKPKGRNMVTTSELKPGEKLTELSVNMVPASLIELPPSLKGYSKKAIRRLIQTGQAKLVKKGDKFEVKSTGRYAPPASEIGKEMGVAGSSRADLLTPTGIDLKRLPDIRKQRGTGRKMPSLGERIAKAKRSGEPTSLQELRKRQAEVKSKEINDFFKTEKEAIKDAGKSIKDRIKKVEEMAKKGTISLSEAKRRTKRLKKSAMKEIKYQKERPKRSILTSPSGMTMTTKHNKGGKLKSNYPTPPMQKGPYKPRKITPKMQQDLDALKRKGPYKPGKITVAPKKQYMKTGGKVGSKPRGCGAAMRGYGKAMKGSR